MVAIKKQKNKAYVLLESLVALGVLVTICSFILSALHQARSQEAERRHQIEVLNLAQMAIQTEQSQLSLNKVAVKVQWTEKTLVVYEDGQEVIMVEKD
ncbi:TPA: Type II secretory pathway, pseudopilin PulG [Streptococcus suis]|nr:Type II secretory pathway, pseudopilin PulG [Streptococcus suis]